jgi:hypothetical protein
MLINYSKTIITSARWMSDMGGSKLPLITLRLMLSLASHILLKSNHVVVKLHHNSPSSLLISQIRLVN